MESVGGAFPPAGLPGGAREAASDASAGLVPSIGPVAGVHQPDTGQLPGGSAVPGELAGMRAAAARLG